MIPITINHLKLNDATYRIDVGYTKATEEGTLKTHDEPRPSFYRALAGVLETFLEYYGATAFPSPALVAVMFGEDDTRVELELRTETALTGFFKSLKIKRRDELNPDMSYNPADPRNLYNEAIRNLEDEVREYLAGNRAQKTLSFAAEESPSAELQKQLWPDSGEAAGNA